MSTTILQNLQNASKERDVSLEKVEEFLHSHSVGYGVRMINAFVEDTHLFLIAQFLGAPLSRLVEGVETHQHLYRRSVFDEEYERWRAAGKTLPPREQAWIRLRQNVEGHDFTHKGFRRNISILIDGLASPSAGKMEACDHLNCDCVGLCKVTGRRMDAAG